MTTTTSNADQDQSRCEAADAGPAAASPPREDHWDQEDGTGLYGPRGWTVRAGVWRELARCRDELRSTVIPAEFGHNPRGLITEEGAPQEDYTPYHDPLQKKVVAAAEGTRIIQVSGEVRGLRENPECELRLVGTNRRQWISLTWHVRACARQGQTTELILLFEVPERDVAAIAGLAHLPRRQLARTPVVTPAEPR